MKELILSKNSKVIKPLNLTLPFKYLKKVHIGVELYRCEQWTIDFWPQSSFQSHKFILAVESPNQCKQWGKSCIYPLYFKFMKNDFDLNNVGKVSNFTVSCRDMTNSMLGKSNINVNNVVNLSLISLLHTREKTHTGGKTLSFQTMWKPLDIPGPFKYMKKLTLLKNSMNINNAKAFACHSPLQFHRGIHTWEIL